MARKRDHISEIHEIRSRSVKRADRWTQFTKRNDSVIAVYDFLAGMRGANKLRYELLRYIPIALVAAIESYFRMVFRDLIDFGTPYDQNVRKLPDIKLDFLTILDLRREKISPGEFIAHMLSVNNLEGINSHMSALMGSDFLESLNNTEVEFPSHKIKFKVIPGVYQGLNDMFSLRHIYCHEMALKSKITFETTANILWACTIFVFSTETLLEQLLVTKE